MQQLWNTRLENETFPTYVIMTSLTDIQFKKRSLMSLYCLFCLHEIRMRRTRWWPQTSGSSKYVMMRDKTHAKDKVQYKATARKCDESFPTGMEWLQTPLEPRGIWKCHLHPYSLRDHLEARHCPLQQVRICIYSFYVKKLHSRHSRILHVGKNNHVATNVQILMI